MYQQSFLTTIKQLIQNNFSQKNVSTVITLFQNPRISIPGIFVALLLLITACQNDNIVGSSFIPVEPNVQVDTLLIEGFEPENLMTFTGNHAFFSVGDYNDELFGNMNAVGYIAPGLVPPQPFQINDDAEMYILLFPQNFYGNQEGSITFGLHYIEERWRSTAINKESDISFDPVPFDTFTIDTDSDSVAIRLPQDWVDRYRDEFFNFDDEDGDRNQNLVENEFGFAIVPQEGDLMVGVNGTIIEFDQIGAISYSGTRLLVRNPAFGGNGDGDDNGDNGQALLDEEDDDEFLSFSIPFRGWAYTYNVDNESGISSSLNPVYNTFEKVIGIDLADTFDKFQDQNISRAELVVFEDMDLLESTLPANHERTTTGRVQFYRLEEVDLDFIVTRPPLFEPLRNNNDGSYRVNLTETIRNLQLGASFPGKLYITSGPNNGLLIPNLIVTDPDNPRFPKLIVTRLDPQEN